VRSEEDLGSVIGRIEARAAELGEKDLPLDRRVAGAAASWEAYRAFWRRLARPDFSVTVLREEPRGGICEEPFDWAALDAGSR
jgi:hypothetical protein